MKWFCYSLIGVCLLMCSCRTEYVPIEVVRLDSLYFSKILKDSVYIRDSVLVKGDTVVKNKYVYVYRNLVDTFYVYRDKEIEVPVPVERKLSWWEKMKMDFGGWVILIVALYVVYRMIRWLVLRYRKSDGDIRLKE